MSELINNSKERKKLLKHMILQLHEGEAPDLVKKRLTELLRQIPYDDVVEVEQELINEGLPVEEVLKLCDVHTEVLDGHIDQSGAKEIPPGHPVDVFKNENIELKKRLASLDEQYLMLVNYRTSEDIKSYFFKLKELFNDLYDVEKHYLRKENLLFPYLEKNNITGPPKVMWGKHDETRDLLKAAAEALTTAGEISSEEAGVVIQLILIPASKAVNDMIMKEDEILFPMAMDLLTEGDWYEIQEQTLEIGYCLYDPAIEWKPEGLTEETEKQISADSIQLPSGSFMLKELIAVLNKLPVDMTFVDRNDKVKFFSQGEHRIFHRSRAILNRDIRMCHPPSSMDVVDQILNDFKSGKEEKASFWIQMGDKFILIEYYALKDDKGDYFGTLEVSQDLTYARSLKGEQRLLSYSK